MRELPRAPRAPRHDRSRRDFIKAAGAAVSLTTLGLEPTVGITATAVPAADPLCALSAASAVAAMQRGDISAEDYAGALLAQAARHAALNVFIALAPDAVLEAARGADQRRKSGKPLGTLHGLPLPVKDSINTRALPTTAGTAALRDFRPGRDAPVLDALFAQGAYLFGKTNLHELSLGYTSNNAAFGAVRNPYDVERVPGGSSGGSAAAVAAAIAPLAVAEDTMGSIRVPAALCGLAGLRPSIGRYPKGGVVPLSPRFDTVGALARRVEDLILFDAACERAAGQRAASHPARDRRAPLVLDGARLGVPEYHCNDLDPEVEALCRAALQRLAAAGAVLVPCAAPPLLAEAFDITSAINLYEAVANQSAYLREFNAPLAFADLQAGMSAPLRKRFETMFKHDSPEGQTAAMYRARVAQLRALRTALPQFYADNRLSALVFPTTRVAAPLIGEDLELQIRGVPVPIRLAMARNVAGASCAGIPGLSLPAGLTATGLPVGLEFDMLSGEDRRLLDFGLTLERTLGPIALPPGIA